ncbi:MAG: glycosyl transferase [Methylococcales bacterium]|nr:glycosyl transferase [Methylococcales bacterium]
MATLNVSALMAALLLSGFGIAGVFHYARHKLLDRPNARSAHQAATPRGAGLAVVLAIFCVLGLAYHDNAAFWPLWAGLPIAWVGWLDDHGHVAATKRLLVHGLCAVAALLLLPLPWLALAPLLLVLVWALNLFNFMDGIDGLAGSEAVFFGASLSVLLSHDHLMLSTQAGLIAAASAGFLFWNWPPAKIFLGDVGSGFLGFALALTVLEAALYDNLYAYQGLILSAGFWVDASITLVVRMATGQVWYRAHNLHGYQKAARRFGAVAVLWGYWALNLGWLLPMAWLVGHYPDSRVELTVLALLPLTVAAWYLRAGHLAVETRS